MIGNLDPCLRFTLPREGGFVQDPRDPGGATNRGITQGTLADWRGHPVTVDDVRTLTLSEATAIYAAQFWNTLNCDGLPAGVDLVVFDFGVNSGVSRSAKLLQKCVGVHQDGHIGNVTIAAVLKIDPLTLTQNICDARMAYLRGLGTWRTYKNGWSARVSDARSTAATMVAEARKPQPPLAAIPAPVPPTELAWLFTAIFNAIFGGKK